MRKLVSSIFGLILLLSSLSSAVAQSCETIDRGDFTATPPRAPSVCAGLIDYEIYNNGSVCQAQIESGLTSLPTVNTLLSPECQIAINLTTCGFSYLKCGLDANDSPVPIYPCRSLCQDVKQSCGPLDLQLLTVVGLYTNDMYDCDNWPETGCNAGPDTPVTSQNIQQPQCITYPGGVCENSVPSSIYIPAGYSYEILEAGVAAAQFTFALAPRTDQCDALHQAFTCSKAYMECEKVVVSLGPLEFYVPGPKLPCHGFCEAYKTNCQKLFDLAPELRYALEPDCEKNEFGPKYDCDWNPNFDESQPSYPTGPTVLADIGGNIISTTCSNYSEESSTEIASVVHQINAMCPFPLVIPETDAEYVTRINEGACAPSCPMNLWSPDEYKLLDRITLAGAIISFLCTLFLTITWSCFSFSKQNVYIKYMSYNLLAFFLVLIVNYIRAAAMGTTNAPEAMCKNNVEEYQFEGYCLFQGIVFIYAILSACSWWLVQAIDIFRALVLNIRFQFGSKLERNWKLAYHIFGWGPPMVALIIGLSVRQIGGYNAGSSFCTFSEGRYTGFLVEYDKILFYYPMFAYAIIGCVLMIIVMFRLWYISKKHVVYANSRANNPTSQVNSTTSQGSPSITQGSNDSKSQDTSPQKVTSTSDTPDGQAPTREAKRFTSRGINREICLVYTRIMIYLFSMAVIWSYLFFYKIYSQENKDAWKEGFADYYACLLIPSGEDCGDHPQERMPFGLMVTLTVMTTFAGALTMIMNATSIDIYQEWAGFIYDRCYCCLFTTGCRNHCRQYSKHRDTDEENEEVKPNIRRSTSDGAKPGSVKSLKNSNVISQGIVNTIPASSPLSSRVINSQRNNRLDDDSDDSDDSYMDNTNPHNRFHPGASNSHVDVIELESRKSTFAGFSIEEDVESAPATQSDPKA